MNFTHIQLPSRSRLLIAGLICSFILTTASSVLADEVILQDGQMRAAFDTDSGALVRLENGSTSWVNERHPELSVPFRMNMFSPAQKHDFVYAEKHKPAEIEKISST